MTRYTILAATILVSAAAATPVLAQPVIDEPGAYAFYHPNADLGLGSSRPAGAMAAAPLRNSDLAQLRSSTMSHPLPARHARSNRAY
ncbi:MAG: hypothetical protein QOC84_1308 [Bradyrhizobium sp.]|jgi:hypothetical protein|nr:hypothetical protein [Bradyrhizobium sp.]